MKMKEMLKPFGPIPQVFSEENIYGGIWGNSLDENVLGEIATNHFLEAIHPRKGAVTLYELFSIKGEEFEASFGAIMLKWNGDILKGVGITPFIRYLGLSGEPFWAFSLQEVGEIASDPHRIDDAFIHFYVPKQKREVNDYSSFFALMDDFITFSPKITGWQRNAPKRKIGSLGREASLTIFSVLKKLRQDPFVDSVSVERGPVFNLN